MKSNLPQWPGDCYGRAAKVMIDNRDNPEIRLVHGEVPDSYHPGQWVMHAWCELPATFESVHAGEPMTEEGIAVCDMSQPDVKARMIPREMYYGQLPPRNIKRYTFDEMMAQARRFGHDGPWTN